MGTKLDTKIQCLKFSFPGQPSSSLRNSKPPSYLFILVKRVTLLVENRWSIFRSALAERWEAQNDCRAFALLTSAHAPLCSCFPGASVHSITLILCEQVSQCSQKFKPASCHLGAGNISKSDLTTEALAGKGSSAAPSSPMYQRLCLVSSQHQLQQGLPPISHYECTAQTDFALSLSLLLPSAPQQSWKNQDRRGDDLCNTSTAFATHYTSTGCSGKQPHVLIRELAMLICVVQPSQLPILFPLSQIARHF